MSPKDIAKKLKFRSALSRTMKDGVTAPCGKSVEREVALRCAKLQMKKEEKSLACKNCSEALVFGGGQRRGKKAKQSRG